MDNAFIPTVPPSLLLEIGQAFHSMQEFEPTLFSALKEIQHMLYCEDIMIWLINEMKTEIKCVYMAGTSTEKLHGSVFQITKSAAEKLEKADKHQPVLDAEIYRQDFNISAHSYISIPLIARGSYIGEIGILNKIGKGGFTSEDKNFVDILATHLAVSIQNTYIYEKHNRTGERQNLLSQISSHLHQTLDIDELIPRIFMEVNKAINAEAQSIWLVDEKEGFVKCRFATGPSAKRLMGFRVRLNAPSIVGTSVSKQESIIIKDARNDPRHASSADATTGFITRSMMTVPLVLGDKSIGAIQAVNKRDGQLFTQEDLDLFRSIADSAALAVNNAQLVADLQNSYDLTLDALSAALDLRDHETEGHSRRVVEYTVRLSEQIGLDKETIRTIRRGALIHDIGKIGVPDAILHKPSGLTPEERKIIERHPQAGYDMLVDIPYLQEEIEIVICHQEKWDGTGYPRGLKGEEIVLGARLFMIADTFDALTSDRPYRLGCSYEDARKIIEEESGRQFDPKAVDAFLAIAPDEWAQIRARVMEEIEQRRKR